MNEFDVIGIFPDAVVLSFFYYYKFDAFRALNRQAAKN